MAAAARVVRAIGRVPIRVRLTLWVVAMFALVQLVMGVAFWAQVREKAREELDRRLAVIAEGLAAELDGMDRGDRERLFRVSVRSHALLERAAWFAAEYEDASEQRRLYSAGDAGQFDAMPGADGGFDPFSREHFESSKMSGRAERIAAVEASVGGVTVRLAATEHLVSERLSTVLGILVIAGVVGAVASLISGWFIAGLATRPLEELASAASRATREVFEPESETGPLSWAEEPARDATEIAERLEASVEQTRQTLEAQERFLSNVSHELKTPIATLMLEAQTIDRSALPAEGIEFVRDVEEEMRKLGNLIESFLMLTRVTDANERTAGKTVLANEIIIEAIADCEPTAQQYGVRVVPSLADDDAGLDAMIVGDAELLRTLVSNLLRNAIRFSPRGEVVSLAGSVRDGEFLIRVRDRGAGIPKEVLANIFDRFVQSAGESRRGRGHGLGLAIAKGIAELHGGDIAAATEPDGGAVFTATLPIHTADGAGGSATNEGDTERGTG